MPINAPDPSYGEGYAPFNGPPKNPSLWQGLIFHWDGQLGNTGLLAQEVSGRHLNGTLLDSPEWVSGPAGIDFGDVTGTDKRVEFPGGIANGLLAASQTIIFVADTVTTSRMWYQEGTNPATTYPHSECSIINNAELHWAVEFTGVTTSRGVDAAINADTLYIATGRWRADTRRMELWLNGELAASRDDAANVALGTDGNISTLGNFTAGTQRAFTGTIYSTTWHNRYITDSEIQIQAGDRHALTRLAPMPAPVTTGVVSDIDTREKRASVPGVARPYARGKLPTTIDAAWRQATGLTYAGSTIAAPAGGFVPAYAANANTLLGGGTA